MTLEINNISLRYKGQPALSDISLTVDRGETVSILGPSGCGKSTLLNIVSGLLSPDCGNIVFNGRNITSRSGIISYMQQKDLLLPWKTILDNASLGAILRGEAVDKARRRALALLNEFGLDGYENHYPFQLSGGMRQRAAFLRTFLFTDRIMLLDEPFSGLDAITRQRMQSWLQNIRQHYGFSILLVTHDPEEAIFLSDSIIVFFGGPRMYCRRSVC